MFLKAQKTYIDKLWNGEYFRYDAQSEYRDSIQADQLAGQWYANMTGLGDLVPKEMQISALKKIFANNVMKFGKGEMGAANGMASDGSVIRDNERFEILARTARLKRLRDQLNDIGPERVHLGMEFDAPHAVSQID